jgi:nucleoporin NUP82
LSKPLDFTALIDTVTAPASSKSDPRSLIRSRPDARKPLDSITTAHLTLLGEITTLIRKRTEAIRAASQTVENRLDLQVREYQRQIKLLKSARGEMKDLRIEGGGTRVEGIAAKQRELSERLDKVLSGAMASHEGADVSESERKWFDELDKLGSRVGGLSKRFDTVSQPNWSPIVRVELTGRCGKKQNQQNQHLAPVKTRPRNLNRVQKYEISSH